MLFNRFFCILAAIFTLLTFFGCSHSEPVIPEFYDGVYVSDFWEVLIRQNKTIKYGSIDSDWDGNADCDVPVNLDSEMTAETFTGEIVEVVSYTNYDVYYILCSSHTPFSASFLGDTGIVDSHENANCIVPLIVQPIDGGVRFAQYYSTYGILADDSICSNAVTCFENLTLAKKNVEEMDEPMFSTGIRQP